MDANDDKKEPAWFRSPVKWMEDDAGTPDRERAPEAWMRLYGRSLREETPVEDYDGGDTFATLYEGGRIYINSCGLAEIREVAKETNE